MPSTAPILVMRHGPLIGYVAGRSITTVAKRCATLADALAWTRAARDVRDGYNRFWFIARAGQRATRAGKFVKA
jgi:hypothetical protein